MPWELVDALGNRYRLPASLQPAQLHVGGRPRVRFVRGYGSGNWYSVLDGIREPEALNLVGVLQTDRDEVTIQALLEELEAAALSAVKLVHVDHDGVAVKGLPLLGSLPITAEPAGVDGTMLQVTLPLVPGAAEWAAVEESSSGGAVTPPTFTPADLPGLYLWLDASDAATITQASGVVSAWADKSGNGRNASQGTSGNRPTYQATGLNGRPTVRFDGADDNMVLAGFTHLTTLTVAVVARPTNLSGFRGLVGRTEASPWRHNWSVGLDSAKHVLLYYGGVGSVYPRAEAADAVTVNTAYVFTSRLDSSPAAHLWQDGELQNLAVDTIAPSPANFGTGVLGANDAGTSGFFAGDISEVVITSGALSDEDVAKLNAYLLSKWSI